MSTKELPGEGGHRPYQGMDGPAVFEIAAKPDAKPVEPSLFPAQCHHVGQGLGRMQMPAVPGVDDWDTGIQRRGQRRTGDRMPHGDDVGIPADHPDGVFKGFPLETEELAGLSNPMIRPPSRSIAVWKDICVRVDGS